MTGEVPAGEEHEVPPIFRQGLVLPLDMEVVIAVREERSLAAVAQAANSRHLPAFLPSSNRQIGVIGVLALLRGKTPTNNGTRVLLKGMRRSRARSLSKMDNGPSVST